MNPNAILERIFILEEKLLKDKTLSEEGKHKILEEISELEKKK